MPRQKTIRAFDEWRKNAANVDTFFLLMEGTATAPGKRFRDVCVELKVPYTLMHAFVKADVVLKARYDAVRAAKADQFAHEAVEIADEADEESKAGVAKAKLQVDTRLALASKWDRDDYGDTLRVEKTVTVQADAGLLGLAGELLTKISSRPAEKVIEGVALAQVAGPEPAALQTPGSAPARAAD